MNGPRLDKKISMDSYPVSDNATNVICLNVVLSRLLDGALTKRIG